MTFPDIQAIIRTEESLIETLEDTDVRLWSALCEGFVRSLETRLLGNPALLVGVVLHLVERIQKLPGSQALPNADHLREAIEHRYRRWQGENAFVGLASDVHGWLARTEPSYQLSEVTRFVDAHLSERLTTQAIARRFGYSRRRLGTLFKAELGITLRDYIQERRMRRALNLVRRGEKVEVAMLQVGYHNKTHFYRAFEKRTGHKPGQARWVILAGLESDPAVGAAGSAG